MQSYAGFEIGSPIPFHASITVMPRAPPLNTAYIIKEQQK